MCWSSTLPIRNNPVMMMSGIPIRMSTITISKYEQRTKHRFSKEIQHTVENCLGIRRDDITAFANAPGYGVHEPEERGETAAIEEAPAHIVAKRSGMSSCLPDKLVEDIYECCAACHPSLALVIFIVSF